ncbi:unnamed protein product [Lymnaea stagnalis]|uniref:Uncharacterized protein n=1 Tax=Lymnaea stagnalis TaxID=6523 RepID=A0AAV2I549_LYMST
MEVILDRRLMQDDWRGLNEGAQDNKVNPSRFILLPEKRDAAGQTKGAICYPSTLAHLLSSHLHNPLQVAVMTHTNGIFETQVRFQNETWPCSCKLLNLRNLGTGNTSSLKALLVVHRVGLDCSYSQIYTDCNNEEKVNLNVFGGVQIKMAAETTLTGVQELTPLNDLKLQLNDMEIKTVKLTYR